MLHKISDDTWWHIEITDDLHWRTFQLNKCGNLGMDTVWCSVTCIQNKFLPVNARVEVLSTLNYRIQFICKIKDYSSEMSSFWLLFNCLHYTHSQPSCLLRVSLTESDKCYKKKMQHTSLSPCFHGNTDEGSCILLHLSSSQRLSLERKSTGQEDSNRRKADDELGGMAVEKEGCSGRDDPVP